MICSSLCRLPFTGSPSPLETLIVGWHSFWGLGQVEEKIFRFIGPLTVNV